MRTRAFVFPHRELPVGARQREEANSQSPLSSAKNTPFGVSKMRRVCARYSALECRPCAGTRVVPQRFMRLCLLAIRDKGAFLMIRSVARSAPRRPPLGELLSECEAEGVRYDICNMPKVTHDTPSVSPFGLPAPPEVEPRALRAGVCHSPNRSVPSPRGRLRAAPAIGRIFRKEFTFYGL